MLVVVVTAGCSFASDAPGTAVPPPDGIDPANDSVEPGRVTLGHVDSLEDRSLSVRAVTAERPASTPGAPPARIVRTATLGANRSTYNVTVRFEGNGSWPELAQRSSYWSNGSSAAFLRLRDGERIVQRDRVRREFLPVSTTHRDVIFAGLTATEVESVERVRQNGTTYFAVEAATAGSAYGLSDAVRGTPASISNASVSMLVAPDGVVHRYRLAYDVVRDGTRYRVTRTVRYGAVGNATVERPGWTDRVLP